MDVNGTKTKAAIELSPLTATIDRINPGNRYPFDLGFAKPGESDPIGAYRFKYPPTANGDGDVDAARVDLLTILTPTKPFSATPKAERPAPVVEKTIDPSPAEPAAGGEVEGDDPAGDDRPKIAVTAEEYLVTGMVLDRLKRLRDVYQRGGKLVGVVSDYSVDANVPTPKINVYQPPLIRELVTKAVRLTRFDGRAKKPVDIHPPEWLAPAIANRGEYPGFRPLIGVTTMPFLRPDGTVVTEAGYDGATGVLYRPVGEQPVIPTDLSLEAAKAAAARLLDLVSDFPFKTPAHRSAWLASLLTLATRQAYKGPSPLVLIDATTRGTGKGKLVTITGTILTGDGVSGTPSTSNDEEMRKRITAIALGGSPVVLLDNISGPFGCAALDVALTSTTWDDRILGKTAMTGKLPLIPLWLATGNNVAVAADTARRVMHVRLESPLEAPEDRTDFKIADIECHVRANRAEYLADVLTIAAAWFKAGKPAVALAGWGSFEGWSSVVRQALAWIGQPDPVETRQALAETSDVSKGKAAALVAGLEEMLARSPEKVEGLTAVEIHARLKADGGRYPAMLEAISMTSGGIEKATSNSIGKHLRDNRGRVIGGRKIEGLGMNRKGVVVWATVPADWVPPPADS